MPPTTNRPDLLGPEWTIPYLALLTLGLIALWISSHLLKRFFKANHPTNIASIAVRACLAISALWITFQLLARLLYLATPWSLLSMATLGGIAIEVAIWLYEHERKIIAEKRGRLLLALRISAILTLVAILLQPVLARESERRLRREIAILIDDSASMQLADHQLTPSEKLKIAALFDIPDARRDQTLTDVQRKLQLLDSQLAAEAQALAPAPGISQAAANSLIARRAAPLDALFTSATARTTSLQNTLRESAAAADGAVAQLLREHADRLANNVTRKLATAKQKLASGDFPGTAAEIQGISRQLDLITERLPEAAEKIDVLYYESLSSSTREKIDQVATKTRSAIARRALAQAPDEGETFVEQLGSDYQLRFFRFGETVEDLNGPDWIETGTAPKDQTPFRRSTDLTRVLESAIESIPSDKLAGVLLLSDGRHNGSIPAEEIARRLGLQDSPICSVVIGSKVGPKDAGIIDVRVPEAIYLDDRAIIQADMKFDGLFGQQVTLSLTKDRRVLDTKEITITEENQRSTIRFAHTPDRLGVSDYEITASVSPGETFTENNSWQFQVAVTDDRTNVLIIESFPRWEFRYLRNLFHARDKSVHLQYVLLNPDEITDAPPAPTVHASADRPFGDSEATALPQGRDQWQKFDAIILGDIPPATFDTQALEDIHHCVTERGALLICSAGPRHMPHAFTDPLFQQLLPITYEPAVDQLESPEVAYRLRLTPEGRSSLIMQQSIDPNINESVWNGLPPMFWRHAITGVKDSAEVLAYAQPQASTDARALPIETASQIAAARALQSENALIVSHRYALGRVLMLNFDRTWRLRYGVGDVYHHKFWGQILRWGTGENLRAGNQFIRLGTDQLSYEPGQSIRAIAKVTDPDNQPINSGDVSVGIYQRNKLVLKKQLDYRPESNGIYESEITSIQGNGRFRIRIEGEDPQRILQSLGIPKVETEFLVEQNRNAVELSELTADPVFLGHIAAISGGSIADPDDAIALKQFFAPPGQLIRERKEITLWDNFPLLLLFLGLVTTEWIARRQAGLA